MNIVFSVITKFHDYLHLYNWFPIKLETSHLFEHLKILRILKFFEQYYVILNYNSSFPIAIYLLIWLSPSFDCKTLQFNAIIPPHTSYIYFSIFAFFFHPNFKFNSIDETILLSQNLSSFLQEKKNNKLIPFLPRSKLRIFHIPPENNS